jgi:hypothetical protein
MGGSTDLIFVGDVGADEMEETSEMTNMSDSMTMKYPKKS